ncbi:MAG TPA: FHA domain-containing protein [Acidimicrobiales bacterium]|nr:FHA domain-containing protein [Acidimicrobiales bacterium]
MAVFCNRCGHRNPEGSNFCSSCGAALDTAGAAADPTATTTITFTPLEADPETDEVAVTVAGPDLGAGVLVVKRGPNAGSRFVLGPEVTTVGRHPDSDVFLDDVTVSRRHAEVYREGGALRVRDVGSLNGTYLNRQRIDTVAGLAHGDELQVGKFRLVLLSEQ